MLNLGGSNLKKICLDRIGYDTVKTWLEGITSSKYVWSKNSQDDIRFDDLEGLSVPEKPAMKINPERMITPVASHAKVIQFSHTLPFYRRPFAIAASVALVMIALFYGIQTESVKPISAGPGQMLQFDLPDGSLATLNSGSRIEFDEDGFREGDRRLDLEGEAWFKVKKGSSFSVNTPNGVVKVLGTQFNVYSRQDGFEVICDEGKVKVSNHSGSVEIGANEGVRYDAELGEFVSSKNLNRSSWREGSFYFENEDLSVVLDELQRQYNIGIDFQGEENQFYTGVFKSGNLENSLNLVCKPLGLKYSIIDPDGDARVVIK